MKSNLRRYCVLLALLLYWVPGAHAQTAPKIHKITVRHVGPQAVSDELVQSNIRIKVGEGYNRNAVDEDVRNLYGTGYFYNIQVAEDITVDGVDLTYVVQGKLLLTDIRFEGNKEFSISKLRKKVTSKVGEPLDEQKLFTDAQELQKLYQKSGYQKTEVKYVLTGYNEATGRSGVTFEIKEAPKIRIKEVDFIGATAFPEKKLRKEIKTRKRWAFSWLTGSGTLKDDEFEDDKEKLADFYRNEGYIDFAIKDVKIDQVTPKKIAIRIEISEGKIYKVGTVEIKGNSLYPTDKLNAELKMISGKTFTPNGLNKDIDALQDFYGAKGYIDTRVTAIKNANVETGTIDVVYQLEELNKSFIEKIEIRGNTKTKDKVIRRELAVAPGEPFDMVSVKLSKKRLEGLNYFEKVDTQAEPTDVPNRRTLVVGVEEKNTGNFTIGAGFSSVDSLVGYGEVTQGNFDLFNPPYFTGAGQKFRLRATLGTEQKDYELSFVEPWFLDRKLAFGVDLYHREISYYSTVYDERQTGGRISLSRALGSDFLIGTMSYTLEDIGIKITDPANASPLIKAEAGSRLVSKVGMSLAYDTRNSTQLPDGGQRTEIMSEVAGGPLGGDTDTYKFEFRTAWYFKGFAPGHVLEANGRAGVIDSYGSTSRVPLFDRFFLGGLYTLRGYKYQHVGPKDSLGEPIGGDTYWFGSLEYSIPIIDRLRFATFYDIGMVYQSPWSLSYKGSGTKFYNDNAGIGVRLNLPIGPLRLDYGFPITSDANNGGGGRFQFGVGYTRDF